MLVKRLTLTLILFIAASILAPKASAQESSAFFSMGIRQGFTCTNLNTYLLMYEKKCENKKLTQADRAVKAAIDDKSELQKLSSYSFEAEYYVPPTPTPTVIETQIDTTKTPDIVSSQTQAPMDMIPADAQDLNSEMILELINAHRASIGKAPFQKDEALCSLAKTRSYELQGELFEGKGYLHSGLYNRNLPYWITENAKWGSNEAGTVRWWLNSPIHRKAIEGDYSYSCGACSGSKCSQLFTSYTPKATAVAPIQKTTSNN